MIKRNPTGIFPINDDLILKPGVIIITTQSSFAIIELEGIGCIDSDIDCFFILQSVKSIRLVGLYHHFAVGGKQS